MVTNRNAVLSDDARCEHQQQSQSNCPLQPDMSSLVVLPADGQWHVKPCRMWHQRQSTQLGWLQLYDVWETNKDAAPTRKMKQKKSRCNSRKRNKHLQYTWGILLHLWEEKPCWICQRNIVASVGDSTLQHPDIENTAALKGRERDLYGKMRKIRNLYGKMRNCENMISCCILKIKICCCSLGLNLQILEPIEKFLWLPDIVVCCVNKSSHEKGQQQHIYLGMTRSLRHGHCHLW